MDLFGHTTIYTTGQRKTAFVDNQHYFFLESGNWATSDVNLINSAKCKQMQFVSIANKIY